MANLMDRRVGMGLSLHPSYNLTNEQVEQDQILTGFRQEASQWQNLVAMMAGGLAYRLGKIGVYSVGANNHLPLQIIAPAIGLATEVSAFREVHQILSSPTSPSSWLTDTLNFGTLKIFGHWGQKHNPLFRHFMQDAGMVAGHQLAYSFHLSTAPQGTLVQQLFHAESTNLAMAAGMSLGHFVTGGRIHLFEKSLDITLSSSGSHALRGNLEAGALRLLDGTQSVQELRSHGDRGNEKLSESAREIQIHRNYMSSLLRLSWRNLNALLHEKAEEGAYSQIRDWLEEVRRVQQELLPPQISAWRVLLWEAYRQGEIDRQHLDQRMGLMDLGVSAQAKAQRVLVRTQELAQKKQGSDFEETDLKRRIQWLEALPLLSGEVPPSDIFRFPEKTLPLRAQHRREMGEILLRTFLPSFSSNDLDLYLRAAEGSVRGRSVAFDLDSTLGDTRKAYLAVADIARDPEKYDIDFNYFLHQNLLMRIPYRGMQAVLLGLWAAGNELKLYTASENLPENHEAFFNDFPLLKVAFGLVPSEDPFRLVSTEDLDAHPNYMSLQKRSRFYEAYFASEGQVADFEKVSGLGGVKLLLREAKIPFPDFHFDLLVDDHDDPHHEMQMLGFGNRWVLASSSAKNTLVAIENHFAQTRDATHPDVRGWLGENKRSLDVRLQEVGENSPLQRTVRSLFETEAWADGVGSIQQILLREVMEACLSELEAETRNRKMATLVTLMEKGLPEADFRKFVSENLPHFFLPSAEKITAPVQAAEIEELWMGFSREDSAMMLRFILEISEGDAALISRWIKIVGDARRSGRYMPPEINAALAVARNHPAGKLILRRIFQIFAVEDEASKVREIAALETRPEHGIDIRSLLLAGEDPESIAEAINQTIHTAYMDDIRLARKVVSVMQDVSGEILDATSREKRREGFDTAFWDLMRTQKIPDVSDLFHLLNLYSSAQSRLLEQQWREGKFEVLLLPGEEFDTLVAEWGQVNDCNVSVFEMRESPLKDRIILRAFSYFDFHSEAGRQKAYSEILERIYGILHEGEHWRHFSGHYEGIETSSEPFLRGSLSRRDRLVSEMMAYLEEQRFRARVLEVRLWEISKRMGISLPAYLRTQAELSYYSDVNRRILRGLHLASNIP